MRADGGCIGLLRVRQSSHIPRFAVAVCSNRSYRAERKNGIDRDVRQLHAGSLLHGLRWPGLRHPRRLRNRRILRRHGLPVHAPDCADGGGGGRGGGDGSNVQKMRSARKGSDIKPSNDNAV